MIASHNSWTFAKPIRWWMWFVAPFSKCQSKTIQEQVESGAVMLDLRLKVYNKCMYVAHGGYIVNEPFFYQLITAKPKYCRVLLESRNPTEEEITLFKWYCDRLVRNCPDTVFFGGHGAHKPNWKETYYTFPANIISNYHGAGSKPEPELDRPREDYIIPRFTEYHASVNGHYIPYIWSRRHNKDVQGNEYITMIDFIE